MSTSDNAASGRIAASPPAPAGTETRSAPVVRLRSLAVAAAPAADFVICIFAVLAAYGLDWRLQVHGLAAYPLRQAAAVGCSLALLMVMLQHREGGYRGRGGLLRIRDTERALRLPVQAVLVLLPFGLFLQMPMFGSALLLTLVLLPGALIALRRLTFGAGGGALTAPADSRVVAYGDAASVPMALSSLEQSRPPGLTAVGVMDGGGCRPGGTRIEAPGYSGPITAEKAAGEAGCRALLLSASEMEGRKLPTNARWPYEPLKRVFDFLAAAALLLLLSPLFPLLAAMIRLDSPGSAIFSQDRVGRGGELFTLYKFRTMFRGTPRYAPSPVTRGDARITRMGRILRQSCLDELPQLWNVLRGDMSLVGPRPEMPFLVRQYTREQRQRLRVPAGITGLWQLSADRRRPIHENLQYDLYYIRHRGLFMDGSILLHTLFFAAGRGL